MYKLSIMYVCVEKTGVGKIFMQEMDIGYATDFLMPSNIESWGLCTKGHVYGEGERVTTITTMQSQKQLELLELKSYLHALHTCTYVCISCLHNRASAV